MRAAVFFGLLVSGSSAMPTPVRTNPEQQAEETSAIGEARLQAIGRRLLTAGAAICPLKTDLGDCRSRLRLVPTRRIRASANGTDVTVTTGLLAFTRDDHELAFVLAHEIAHNAWGHAALLARPGGKRLRKATELEADANALRLMRAAGYDIGRVLPFLHRLYDGPAGGLFASAGHLGRRERVRALQSQVQ